MHPHHAMGVRHDFGGAGCSPHHEGTGHHMGGPHNHDKHPLGMHGALHGDGMTGYHGATSSYESGDEGGAASMHDNEHHELAGHNSAAQGKMEEATKPGESEKHEHGAASKPFPGAAPPFGKKR